MAACHVTDQPCPSYNPVSADGRFAAKIPACERVRAKCCGAPLILPTRYKNRNASLTAPPCIALIRTALAPALADLWPKCIFSAGSVIFLDEKAIPGDLRYFRVAAEEMCYLRFLPFI